MIAQNGRVGSLTDGPGNIVINGQDTLHTALMIDAGGTMSILAGDNLTEMQGASIQAGVSVFLNSDYAGDLNGVPPRVASPTQFVTIGATILLAGLVAAAVDHAAGRRRTRQDRRHRHLGAQRGLPLDPPQTFPRQLGRFAGSSNATSLISITGGAAQRHHHGAGPAIANDIIVVGRRRRRQHRADADQQDAGHRHDLR